RRLRLGKLLEIDVLALMVRVSQPLVKWMRLSTHNIAAYDDMPESTRPRPALERTHKRVTYSSTPRSVIDDQAHNLDLWFGNKKVALFRSDPAEKIHLGL